MANNATGFADWETRAGFAMAITLHHRLADMYLSEGTRPRCIFELQLMKMGGAMRDDPEKWNQLDNDTLTNSWREQALVDAETEQEREYRSQQFDFALAECKWLRSQCPSMETRPGGVDGTFVRDDIDADLINSLLTDISLLRSRPAIGSTEEDRTGHTIDLVHPSLYAYERGKTQVLENADANVDQALPWNDFLGLQTGHVEPHPRTHYSRETLEPYQPLGSPAGLQWLPSEFRVNSTATHCEIRSYINSLHPTKYFGLYRALSTLFCRAVPLLEEVLAELGDDDPNSVENRERPLRIPTNVNWWLEDPRPQRDNEAFAHYVQYLDHFDENQRTFIKPPIPAFAPPQYNRPRSNITLRDRPLQVITKIASIELEPGESYEGGVWHVEGTLEERIVATACCYLDCQNVSGGDLHFRTQVIAPDFYTDNDRIGVRKMFHLVENEPLIQDYGHCSTPAGRILAWPNTLQHRVGPVNLIDPSQPGKRTICCFFLVDPTLRVRSTATVPPQQLAWLKENVLDDALKSAGVKERVIRDNIANLLSSETMMTFEQACERRNRIIEERSETFHRNDESDRFFARPCSLCQH